MSDKLFIKLGNNKRPAEKWSQEKFRYDWETIINSDNYAFVPPVGYTVLDADDKEAVNRIKMILFNFGIQTPNWPTDKGHHWLFKVTEHVPNPLPTSRVGGKFNILGLAKLDYKGYNKGYVRISGRVEPDTIIKAMTEDTVAELPLILSPNKAGFDMTNFPEGERHDIMFRMWIPKLRSHWSNKQDDLKKLLFQIVKGYHKDPDSDEKIWEWVNTNVDSSFSKGDIELNLKKHYDHYIAMSKLGIGSQVIRYDNLFDSLIKRLKLVRDKSTNQIWGWNNDRLEVIDDLPDLVREELFNNSTNLKPSIIGELIIALPSRIPKREPTAKPYEITFSNGIYNAHTKGFDNSVPEFAQNIIQHQYIDLPKDEFEKVYKTEIAWIKNLFRSWGTNAVTHKVDEDVVTELLELTAYAMTRLTEFEKSFMLVGNAMNGKSIYLKLLVKLLGKNNTSAEDLQAITDGQFSSSQLYGKLANINADISSSMIKDPATFKRLVSGDLVSAQFKGKDAFTFEPYATIILGVNNIPYVNEGGESDAVDRRLKLIHFANKYKKTKDFYKVVEYLHSERTLSVVIRLALDAFGDMLNTTGLFTESKSAKALMDNYILDTDHVAEFLNVVTLNDGSLESEVYARYTIWSDTNGYKHVSKNMFTKKAIKYYRRRSITLIPEHKNKENVKVKVYRFYR